MRRSVRVLIVLIVVFIISTVIGVNLILKGDDILVNFDIVSLTNKGTTYTLEYESVKAALEYKIEIRSDENRKVFEKRTDKTSLDLELTNLTYGTKYYLMVYAYDVVGDYRPANKEIEFVWNEPSINNTGIVINDKDYKLVFNGTFDNNSYYIKIFNGKNEILSNELKENEFVISKDLFKDKKIKLDVKIYNQDVVVDEISLYKGINPLTNVKITSIEEGKIYPLRSITLNYNGGDNASNYVINLYENDKLKLSKSVTKKNVVLDDELFLASTNYKLEVIAVLDKYKKKSSVSFITSDKEQLEPVYISNNWKQVRSGSKIELKAADKDAKIYYTLDGKSPESFGTLYTGPITIKKNVTLKTVAVKDEMINSIVKEYKINVREKEALKVYISPSNQSRNLGVSDVDYTNEMDEMNDVADYVIERLKSYGVKVYRNYPSGGINAWLRDSNYFGADVHLAIHSNASIDHKSYGIETWINNENSDTYSLGNIIQNNLMSIYPYKDREGADRGVKYANGALGECNDAYLPFGILVEVAHHDDYNDALWIMNNKKLIGYNLADSILEYYQIIE